MSCQKKQALKDKKRTLNIKNIEPLSSMPVCSPVPTSSLSYSEYVTDIFDSTATWKQKILMKS